MRYVTCVRKLITQTFRLERYLASFSAARINSEDQEPREANASLTSTLSSDDLLNLVFRFSDTLRLYHALTYGGGKSNIPRETTN